MGRLASNPCSLSAPLEAADSSPSTVPPLVDSRGRLANDSVARPTAQPTAVRRNDASNDSLAITMAAEPRAAGPLICVLPTRTRACALRALGPVSKTVSGVYNDRTRRRGCGALPTLVGNLRGPLAGGIVLATKEESGECSLHR